MFDICMVNPYDPCIPIWMILGARRIITSMDHDITVGGAWIEGVLTPPQIICGEVDAQDMVRVETVVCQPDSVVLGRSVIPFIPIILMPP